MVSFLATGNIFEWSDFLINIKSKPAEFIPNRGRTYKILQVLCLVILFGAMFTMNAFAAEDLFSKANSLIVDIYNKIAGISTVLAGLMSAIAVIGAKISNNQHKVDQAWDWLKRIWVAWAVINGIGAFIAYIRPLFEGLNSIE